MPKSKKEYLVIGSNNFWYATCDTLSEAKEEVKNLCVEADNDYGDPETGHKPELPYHIYIYKATLKMCISTK